MSVKADHAGSLCPWFTKLAALLWNDFLHPWKASASAVVCSGTVSDQQLECGVYAVLCNLCLLCLWGNWAALVQICFFYVDDLIPFTLPQGSTQMKSSVNHLLAGHSCEETCL